MTTPPGFTANEYEDLANSFVCMICNDRLKMPQMCTSCGHFFCYECILNWTSKNSIVCPNCRKSPPGCDSITNLCMFQLKSYPWVFTINNIMRKLNHSQLTKVMCLIHTKEVSIYCSTCNQCICHKCAIWDDKHDGHEFTPLEEIYEDYLAKINKKVKSLDKERMELDKFAQKASYLAKSIEEEVKVMHAELDQRMNEKLKILNNQMKTLNNKSEQMRNLLEKEKKKLGNATVPSIVNNYDNICTTIERSKEQLAKFLPTVNDQLNDMQPLEYSKIALLKNFQNVKDKMIPVEFGNIHFKCAKFKLIFHPKSSKQEDYCSISLRYEEKDTCMDIFVTLTMTMRNLPNKQVVRDEQIHFHPDYEYFFHNFYKIDLLSSDGFVDDFDNIGFKITLTSPRFLCAIQI